MFPLHFKTFGRTETEALTVSENGLAGFAGIRFVVDSHMMDFA